MNFLLKNKISSKEMLNFLVYANYSILLICSMISMSILVLVNENLSEVFHKISQFFHLTLIPIFIFQILKFKKFNYKLLAVLFAIVIIGNFITSKNIAIYNLLFIPLFFNECIDSKKFYRLSLYIIILLSAIIFILNFGGYLPNSSFSCDENRIRYSLG